MKSQILDLKSQNYILNGKTFIRFAFCVVFLTFAFCVLPLPTASAQTSRTMTIIPPTAPIIIDPGGTSEGTLKIVNDSDEPLTFKVEVQDYIVEDKNGTPNLLPPNSLSERYSATSWIGIAPNEFTVEPHQRQIVQYFIQVPPDARPGGHYAAITYVPQNNTNPQGSGAIVNSKIGDRKSVV